MKAAWRVDAYRKHEISEAYESVAYQRQWRHRYHQYHGQWRIRHHVWHRKAAAAATQHRQWQQLSESGINNIIIETAKKHIEKYRAIAWRISEIAKQQRRISESISGSMALRRENGETWRNQQWRHRAASWQKRPESSESGGGGENRHLIGKNNHHINGVAYQARMRK